MADSIGIEKLTMCKDSSQRKEAASRLRGSIAHAIRRHRPSIQKPLALTGLGSHFQPQTHPEPLEPRNPRRVSSCCGVVMMASNRGLVIPLPRAYGTLDQSPG